ncbi:MAG: hypoxanthine phosphoribosyltransferase [Ruminococcaceae bacterium]|nr:hypoxanthine phosphoribosyltransferase [Oscillospiraceae bacterium]
MNNDIKEVLVTKDEIKEICKKLGKQITEDYKDKKLLLVGVLRGSVVFIADLMKEIDLFLEVDFLAISTYHGTKSTGELKWRKHLDTEVKDFDVLLVEDIVDSGFSLSQLTKVLVDRGAKSVKTCTLLDKPYGRTVDFKADYVGKTVPDAFVVGYGLDYNEKYRNLPYVGILDPKVYS